MKDFHPKRRSLHRVVPHTLISKQDKSRTQVTSPFIIDEWGFFIASSLSYKLSAFSLSLDYSPNPKITLASHTQKTVCFSGKLPACLFGKALSDFCRTSWIIQVSSLVALQDVCALSSLIALDYIAVLSEVRTSHRTKLQAFNSKALLMAEYRSLTAYGYHESSEFDITCHQCLHQTDAACRYSLWLWLDSGRAILQVSQELVFALVTILLGYR